MYIMISNFCNKKYFLISCFDAIALEENTIWHACTCLGFQFMSPPLRAPYSNMYADHRIFHKVFYPQPIDWSNTWRSYFAYDHNWILHYLLYYAQLMNWLRRLFRMIYTDMIYFDYKQLADFALPGFWLLA